MSDLVLLVLSDYCPDIGQLQLMILPRDICAENTNFQICAQKVNKWLTLCFQKGLGTKAQSGDSLSDHPCLILHRHKTGDSDIFWGSTVATRGDCRAL